MANFRVFSNGLRIFDFSVNVVDGQMELNQRPKYVFFGDPMDNLIATIKSDIQSGQWSNIDHFICHPEMLLRLWAAGHVDASLLKELDDGSVSVIIPTGLDLVPEIRIVTVRPEAFLALGLPRHAPGGTRAREGKIL